MSRRARSIVNQSVRLGVWVGVGVGVAMVHDESHGKCLSDAAWDHEGIDHWKIDPYREEDAAVRLDGIAPLTLC